MHFGKQSSVFVAKFAMIMSVIFVSLQCIHVRHFALLPRWIWYSVSRFSTDIKRTECDVNHAFLLPICSSTYVLKLCRVLIFFLSWTMVMIIIYHLQARLFMVLLRPLLHFERRKFFILVYRVRKIYMILIRVMFENIIQSDILMIENFIFFRMQRNGLFSMNAYK